MSNLLLNRFGRTAAMLVAAGFVAHAAGDGNLAITIADSNGKPLVGATVSISSPTQIGGVKTAVSDVEGRVRFVRLSPGDFRVQVSAQGFQTQTLPSIAVRVDQTSSANLKMQPETGATVEVTATVSKVDVTTVTLGSQITEAEIQNLPVGRSQLDTMILVPGVVTNNFSNNPQNNGNPSLTTGLNRDNNGNNGSRNNTYLIDGIDVTSPESGTSRTQIAPELVQVQDVKTGAITAEYSARAGLFSSVTTKVGGNDISAGITAFLQPAAFNNRAKQGKFDVGERVISDYSIWGLGPIIKDKLWFVVNFQSIKDELTVNLDPKVAITPGESRKGVNYDGSRIFAKLTWQISPSDLFSFTYNRDPYSFDNLQDPNVVSRRATKTDRGGNRYIAQYSHQWSNFFLDLRLARHEEDNQTLARFTSDGPQNTIRSTTPLTALQAQLGDSSAYDKRKYKKDLFRADFTWLFDAFGGHTVKGGFQVGQESLNQEIGVGQGSSYESYDNGTYQWSALPSGNVKNSKQRIVTAINNNAVLKAQFVTAGYTPTGPGSTFQPTDLNAYTFNEANSAGGFYSYRIFQQSLASSEPKMKTTGFYVQDQWRLGRWTISPGFRFDQYKYVADNGSELFKTGFNFAPRVGATYDIKGDGRSKIYAYFGRYIDPIKLDMVRFTGSLTSSTRTEDVRMLNQWITYNVRGGTKTLDAVFADSFKLPKTDEWRIGYSTEFAKIYTFEATGTYRRDFDIVEDWDPTLYTSPAALENEARGSFGLGVRTDASALKIVNAFRALAIDPNYFAGGGFTGAQNVARVAAGQLNFVLANLPGGERKYKSLDLAVTRRESNHWGGFASFSFVDAKGNSYSSGNADFQGDLAIYDPRLPYTNGKLDGSVDWLGKAYGYYRWDVGILVGGTFVMNSGYHYTRGEVSSGRVLQSVGNTSLQGSVLEGTFDSEQSGNLKTPKAYELDLRVQYGKTFNKIRGEVYLDIINATNNQQSIALSEGLNVRAAAPLPDSTYSYQLPRRFQLGIRIKY
jgi:Carboxypeptidase regulatory-like domain